MARDYDQRVLVVNDESFDEKVLVVNGNVIDTGPSVSGDFLVNRAGLWVPDTITDADIPASIARDTEVTTAVSTHAAAADPHTGYQQESEKGQNSGYMGLDNAGVGAQTPKAHASRHAPGGADDISEQIKALLPWRFDIDPFHTPIAHTNWNTVASDGAAIYAARQSTGDTTQNNEISFDVVLAAGTWTFELMHMTASFNGIYSVQVDAVEVGTIDGYSASSTRNVRNTVAGIAVAATAKKRLKLKMLTKNASASAYGGSIQHITLLRTA